MAENPQEDELTGDPDVEVKVKRGDLKRLIDTVNRQSRDIDTLYKAASPERLASLHQTDPDVKLVRTCRVPTWEGKFVVASKLVKNISEIRGNLKIEDQSVTLFFEDGTQLEGLAYLEMMRHTKWIVGEILSRNVSAGERRGEENVMLEVQFPDGKKLKIDQKFIN